MLQPVEYESQAPGNILFTFSQSQSKSILTAIKNIGADLTITHLNIAAVVLAMLQTNPPPTANGVVGEDIIYASNCAVDARNHTTLALKSGSSPQKGSEYIFFCQAPGGLVIPDIRRFVLSKDEWQNKSKLRESVIEATRDARSSVLEIKGHVSALSTGTAIQEMIAHLLVRYVVSSRGSKSYLYNFRI
jgi:hypothetical protein